MKKMTPIKIILIFLVASQLWILLTDMLVGRIATSPEMFTRLSMIKGGLYVAVTGTLLYWLISRYASERDSAEAALRNSEQSYKTLSENLPGIIYRVFSRENNRMQFFSKGAGEITGCTDQELAQGSVCPLERLILDEDRPQVVAVVENAVAGHKPFTVEYRLRHKDGSVHFLLEKGTPVYGPDGKILYIDGAIFDVTDRKKAEEAKRQSDSQFLALFDHAPLGIVQVSVNADRRIMNGNSAFQHMLGYSLEELKNLSIRDISDAGNDRAIRGSYTDMMAGEIDSFTVEKRYIRKDRTILWAHLTGMVIRDDKGDLQSIFGIVEDISERKQSENALRESERRYKAIVEDQAEFVVRYLPGGVINFANDTLCKYVKISRDELVGRSYYPFMHPEDREAFIRQIESLDRDHPSMVAEARVVLPGGRVAWHRWTHNAIFDDNGAIVEYQATGRDVTSSKRVEEALRSSEARFRNIIENANTGIMVADIETRQIRYANPEICRVLGYSEQELRSLLTTDLTVQAEMSESAASFQEHAKGNVHLSERTLRRRDGIPVRMSISSVRMEIDDRPSLVGFFSDVTERNLLEEERLKTQKLEAIGTLAGGIAHDFNNLLQGVFGYISLAKLKRNDRDKSLAALEEAEKALHMSVRLTNQLLTFSKGGKPVKKRIDLAPVIENAVKFALSGSRTDYHISIDDGLWHADADEGQMSQVIQNIVLNADQSMPEGGVVEIAARNVQAPSDGLPPNLRKGPYVEITIQDSGVGIAEQYLTKIFDPYFTTKEKGSGLGLATSYSIMKNHNGSIEVRSELDKGTTFSLYIPADEAGKTTPREMPAAAAAPGRVLRVLLMDDEELIRDVAGELIGELGHRVEFALNGREAIDRYREAKRSGDPFDVVILDLTIRGGMGGAETMQTLLEIDPGVKAVVSSGYSEDAVIASYAEQGFIAFLKKPYTAEELEEMFELFIA